MTEVSCIPSDYTIPSNNRELRQSRSVMENVLNYTIPSNNRELRHELSFCEYEDIIPYQVITGNYDKQRHRPMQ